MTPRRDAPDEELDAVFRNLGGVDPPAALVTRTLDAVAALRAAEHAAHAEQEVSSVDVHPPRLGRPLHRRPATRWIAGLSGFAAAAIGLWTILPTPPPVGDPSVMVQRGSGEPSFAVDLALVVRRADGSIERYTDGARYPAGDTLIFRVSSPRTVTVRLLRDNELLWTGTRPAGASELPVGYALEDGQPAADFVLIATPLGAGPPEAAPSATVRVHVAPVAP